MFSQDAQGLEKEHKKVSRMLDTWTLKWRETPASIDGHTDCPLGQGDKLQVGNKSQDDKQQNWTETSILSKPIHKQNTLLSEK